MRFIGFVLVFFLLISVVSCDEKSGFSLVVNKKKQSLNDTISLVVDNPKKKVIDSVVYLFQDLRIATKNKIDFILKNIKLGKHRVKGLVYFEGKVDTISKKVTVLSDFKPKIYSCKILNVYPHDIEAYTQGLEFYKDTLYESTGLNGKSSLRKVDYKTGKILNKMALENAFFGEGITILNDTIYQLTWRGKIGFVYDMNFNKIKAFSYGKSKEGWGICNDGKQLYKSDGSEKIWSLNSKKLVEEDYIQICSDKAVFSNANELEWVEEKIYANTYLKNGIMIISPKNGAILGVVDCRELKAKVKQHDKLDVLNGIAYNPKKQSFFLTGKNWNKLFEVVFIEKK